MKPWRSASDAERRVERLLLVRTIDEDGSLELKPQTGPVAQVAKPVSNGRYFDWETDDQFSPAVNLLLHVVNGRMAELEVYKDDGSEIVVSAFEIDPGRLEVY